MIGRVFGAIGAFFGAIGKFIGGIFGAIGRWAKRRPLQATLLALFLIGGYSAAVLGAGLVGGVMAERAKYPDRIGRRIDNALLDFRASRGDDSQTSEWTEVITNLHTIEHATIRIGDRVGGGGGIVEIDGNIVFASPLGRFGYLNTRNRLGPMADLRTPMNLEGLRQSDLYEDPLFSMGEFRTHDLYARQTGPGRYDLYASFSRFVRDNCFQFVVARTPVEANADGVRALTNEWEDVFIARPGCIRYKDRSWRFIGTQASGRMVELNPTTLLISIGDHQFDGFNDAWNAPMDPATDIGKIIAFNLETRQSRPYAIGFRNPQGLAVMRDGRVWETEHGPQGGDEINFVREGENYGWPLVTYGMNYGYPR
ncbi:MAG: PQQ-dependent sugar dehydrogenase, partial [Hyphomonadaceae bacterium]